MTLDYARRWLIREALERIITPFLSYRLFQVVPTYVQSSAVQVTVVTPAGLDVELWNQPYRTNCRVSGWLIMSPVILMHPCFVIDIYGMACSWICDRLVICDVWGFIYYYVIFWESIQVLQRGVKIVFDEMFLKSFGFTDPLNFVFAPLQVLVSSWWLTRFSSAFWQTSYL